MTINSDKNSTQMETLIYEKPSLKKYGNMKELTLGTSGSGGDGMGRVDNDSIQNDAKAVDDGDFQLGDS